jgi:phospholipase C
MLHKLCATSLVSALLLSGCGSTGTTLSYTPPTVTPATSATAIKHVVVIFGENISFDHYFGTYPSASNLAGEPAFTAATGTSTPAGLTAALLTQNPNYINSANGGGTTTPFRLDRSQAATSDQGHNYTPEQTAYDNLKMDKFPLSTGSADSATLATKTGASSIAATTGLTMGYFDGNTVTAMWNYAQHYALNDHSFGTTFGPSTPGAVNLISGQTNGAVIDLNATSATVADGNGGFTLINDSDPTGDICSTTTGNLVHMTGKNIGDLLTAANVSWGFFEGGFDLTKTNANGTTGCSRTTLSNVTATTEVDYIQHHQPFQYYATTANPTHKRPTSAAVVGTNNDGGANHQYDIHDFTDALAAGNMPAVSYLKAPGFEDAHAGYSDPLDEQTFVVDIVNAIQKSSFWQSTAIVIAYDDSDGWYDHLPMIVNGSQTTADTLTSTGLCATSTSSTPLTSALPGVSSTTLHAQGRCGYGPRIPLMVISPWAKKNYIDSTVTDQSSVMRFIEDTFLSGARLGQGSYDSIAGSMNNMFDFSQGTPQNGNVVQLNDSTGLVTSGN